MNHIKGNDRARKIIFCLLLFFFVFGFVAASPAKAQFITSNVTLDADSIKQQIKDAFKASYENIGKAAGRALTKTLRNFLNKFAQDTATWLASGDYSKGPMWISDAENYWSDAADSAAGDFIGTFGDEWALTKKYGINLCSPGPPELNLALRLSMVNTQNPQPRCKLSDVRKAYERMAEPEYWDKIAVGFQPGQNGLSMSRQAIEAVQIAAAKGEEQKRLAADFAGKILPKEDPVSHQAVTPQKGVENAQPDPQAAAAAKAAEAESAKNDLNSGNIVGVLADAGMMFLDTLSNKLTETLLKKGMFSLGGLIRKIKDWTSDGPGPLAFEAQLVGTRQAAEAYFANFTKPTFNEIEDYKSQYLAEISSDCSTSPSPFCGALDESFKGIFNLAQAGEPITVGEALDKQMLHGEWPLLGPGVPCKPQAYCYDNLVKLRVLRILPIGWELAAKISAKQGQPVSLSKAVQQFYSPADPNINPFFHLVDPNWLIVAPKARCAAQVYGSLFFAEPQDNIPGQRSQYCADIQNCVGEDPKTGICNSWGYCLREKNLWRLGGDACDAQFNTCNIYTDSKGLQTAYLTNTLNKGVCSADNVGCRGYATETSSLAGGLKWNVSGAKIYFDKDVEQCDAADEGCTQFIRTAPEVLNQPLNLKKAPRYYNCYGESLVPTGTPTAATLSSSTLAWAVNKADLFKIFTAQTADQKLACSNFAQVCSAEEKGCELYTPDNGNPAVPGILTVNDQCPNECIGYETYKEQAITQFSGNTTNYFIPSTAKACQSENVGCEEFVNLESQAAGGEQKEYYSALRTCSKDESQGVTYYTWEGSDTTGYQLKTYVLHVAVTGLAPAYNTSDTDLIDEYNQKCNANVYANRASLGSAFDPDCREFYDRQGSKYYRLYSKTITVSPTGCKTLRKTVSDAGSCTATGGIWDATQNFCTYLAITSEAKSCSVEAVGCRAYKGNAGNNFQTTYSQNFESGTVGQDASQTAGWPGSFSAESTVVGGKSLKVASETKVTFASEKDKTYLVYFWAKGDSGTLKVELGRSDSQGNFLGTPAIENTLDLKINNNWTAYTFGPVTADWDPAVASSTLKFSVTAGKSFYLDNVVAKIMTDNIYVIKNSWVTPFSCDNIVGDPLGQSGGGSAVSPLRLVPQAQLGCTSYKNRQGAGVAAKSFTNICRQEAVGCEEMVDTFNTSATSSTVVNALCELDVVSKSNQAVSCKDKNNIIRCDVLPNQQGCHFNFIGTTTELSALTDASTATKETKDAEGNQYSVRFRTDAQSITVSQDKKVYLVNDERFQCAQEKLGCRALGSVTYDKNGAPTSTATSYLKDQPDNYDKILCEQAAEGCDKYAKAGGGNDFFKDPSVFGNKLCEWKDPIDTSHPYGGWVIKGTTSTCYANLNYNILKNKDPGYSGAVGICPRQQSGCSEFVDPSGGGTSANPAGQPYYLINNERIDRSACQGQASLQKGCILFNETAKGDLLWNTKKTYEDSQTQDYEKVNPKDCGPNGAACNNGVASTALANNANVVLKVTRDRVCGEWLACASTMKVIKDGKPTDICTELRNCDEAAVSNSSSDELLGKCAHWVEDAKIYPLKNQYLTIDAYRSYDLSREFSTKDFSGYSITEGYQVAGLAVDNRGGYGLMGKDKNTQKNGVFISQPDKPVTESCRGFSSAEVAKGSEDLCSVTKVTYSGGDKTPIDKFYPANQLLEGSGVCDGGFDEKGNAKRGMPCFDSNDCSDDSPATGNQATGGFKLEATCLTSKQVTRQFGWQGFCLFRDPASKACLQWFPLTTPSNSVNMYALNREAGYYPPEGAGKYWCIQAKGNANRINGGVSYYLNLFSGTARFFPPCDDGYNCTDMWDGSVGPWSHCKSENRGYGVMPGAASCGSLTSLTGVSRTENEIVTTLSQVPNKPKIHLSEVVAVGLNPTEIFDNDWPSTEMLIFRDQRMSNIKNLQSTEQGVDGRYWSGPLRTLGNKWVMDLVWVESKNIPKEMIYETLTQKYCEIYRSNVNASLLAFRLVFDENGFLETIRSKICDAGGADSGMKMDLRFYLTEVCTDIRQVVNNDQEDQDVRFAPFGLVSKARTDRVWSLGNYLLGGDRRGINKPYFDLSYNQFNTPFGSMGRVFSPVTTTLSSYVSNVKSNYEKVTLSKIAGFWPIWLLPDGGTPLNCSGKFGDCGKVGICGAGSPNVGMTCKIDSDPQNPASDNGCEKNVPDKLCSLVNNNVCSGTAGTNNFPISALFGVPCNSISDCQKTDFGPCYKIFGSSGICGKYPSISCSSDQDCFFDASVKCVAANPNKYCSDDGSTLSDPMYNFKCSNDDQCKGTTIKYPCNPENNIRGMCVGGKKHGQICGSNSDCETLTFEADSVGPATNQRGVCVGLSLDIDRTIPTDNSLSSSSGAERVWEIFVRTFGAWKWVDDDFKTDYAASGGTGPVRTVDPNCKLGAYCNTEQWYASGWSRLDCSGGGGPGSDCHWENDPNKSSDLYDRNRDAVQQPIAPKIYSLKAASGASTGYTWGQSSNFSINLQDTGTVALSGKNAVVTAAFFAYADNDQMPIQRVAIDWGDDLPVYQTKGWYKNHKPWCADTENKVCQIKGSLVDLNRPCSDTSDCQTGEICDVPPANFGNRLHFGNSTDACEENYFIFKHVYECSSKLAPCSGGAIPSGKSGCWDSAKKICLFKPKVQILDNWGWCNGTCNTNGISGGCWNDYNPNQFPNGKAEDQRDCYVGKTQPWTSFGGVVEIRP